MERAGTQAARGELLWEPSADAIERATMTRYMRWLAAERGIALEAYQPLWEWSVNELEEFWRSIWDFFRVESAAPFAAVLAERVLPGARGSAGAELNYAHHL